MIRKSTYKVLNNIVLLMMLFLVISGLSCNKSPVLDCFNSTGEIKKVEREIDDFTSIILMDNVNLHLQQAQKNKLILEAGSNLMSKIITEVNAEGVLEIKNDNQCNWVRSYDKPINVYLDFVQLDTLEYRSIGNVTNEDTIRMDTLVIDVKEGAGAIELTVNTYKINTNLHYGTADIITSGRTNISFVYLAGAGKVDNRSLIGNLVYLNNKSSNDIYVNSTSTLEVTIDNIGNVYYLGNPHNISLTGNGSGELIKLED